ncbi:MAG: hypothetical protein JWQ08_1516 [Deinococcus sp.]|nr:hypothetical protein [Deinococcus sp.]
MLTLLPSRRLLSGKGLKNLVLAVPGVVGVAAFGTASGKQLGQGVGLRLADVAHLQMNVARIGLSYMAVLLRRRAQRGAVPVSVLAFRPLPTLMVC